MNTPDETIRADERLSNNHNYETKNKTQSMTAIPFKMILSIIWAIFHFCFYFIQQISEIFAPLLLIVGIAWKILPNIVKSAVTHVPSSVDPQMSSMISQAHNIIPESITFSGHTITASSLIYDGILLLALTAICATITVYLGKKI